MTLPHWLSCFPAGWRLPGRCSDWLPAAGKQSKSHGLPLCNREKHSPVMKGKLQTNNVFQIRHFSQNPNAYTQLLANKPRLNSPSRPLKNVPGPEDDFLSTWSEGDVLGTDWRIRAGAGTCLKGAHGHLLLLLP